jgi:hypothetical protein
MNLAKLAEEDLEYTLEDVDDGFGVNLVFLNNLAEEVEIPCGTTDTGFFIDPDTGIGVLGRKVEINGRISTFENNNIFIEKDKTVKYYDTAGNEYKTSIRQITPDRKMGIIKLLLEAKA